MFCPQCGEKNKDGAKFCKNCGAAIGDTQPHTVTASSGQPSEYKPKSVLFYALMPVAAFIAITVLWGVVNLFASSYPDSPFLDFINNVLVPLLIAVSFLALPVGIVYAAISNSRNFDGTIKCGNCNYVGQGKKGRSVGAQVLVWLLFFVFWPITLIYYLVTHAYECPKCGLTFVGLRDRSGAYTSPRSGMGAVGVVLVSFLVISIIGILAAVVLASLNDARDMGQDAMTEESLNDLIWEAELYYNKNNFSYNGFCDEPVIDVKATTLNLGPQNFRCYDNDSAFAASAPLNGGGYYCVDSTGATVEDSSPLSYRTYCTRKFNR